MTLVVVLVLEYCVLEYSSTEYRIRTVRTLTRIRVAFGKYI